MAKRFNSKQIQLKKLQKVDVTIKILILINWHLQIFELNVLYVDEELTNFAQLDNFVNNPESKSDHCQDKLHIEMINAGVGAQQNIKGYQKADFE